MARRPPPSDNAELDELKRRVNLSEYAASIGYQLDRKASSRNSATMVNVVGDKIIVAKNENGHWVYFSVRDDKDHGSIVDFIQAREGGTIGDVRMKLRPWIGTSRSAERVRPDPALFATELVPVRKDLIAVRVAYEAMKPLDGHHPYLEQARHVPAHILSDPRFSDRMRVDAHGNAIFPHFNNDGLCGWEARNHNFKGYAPGGSHGLWFSRFDNQADRHMIITESAIDALSYSTLHYRPGSRFFSTGGELNLEQPLLLARAMERMPDGSQIILAVDHDPGGTKIGSKLEAIFESVNRSSLTLIYDRPTAIGQDWNDVLRTSPATSPDRAPRPRLRP